MRPLVVFAHPSPTSFAAAALRRCVDEIAVPTSDVVDLYGERRPFDAVVTATDLERIAGASVLVLVYPTWWSAQPALLLAWLQHVATSRPASAPVLTRVVVVSTHGGGRLANAVVGGAGRRTVRRFARAVGGRRRIDLTWIGCYGLDRADPARRVAMLDDVGRRVRAIRREVAPAW